MNTQEYKPEEYGEETITSIAKVHYLELSPPGYEIPAQGISIQKNILES